MNTAEITASPIEVELDGKKFMCSPMTDSDWGEFERWVQARYIELASKNIDKIPQSERQGFLNHAYDRAAAIIFQSPEALQLLTSVDGSAFRTWLGVKRNHPEITFEFIRKCLTDPEKIKEVLAKLDFLDYQPESKSPKKVEPQAEELSR
jgi:hypothetical protein